MSRPRNNGFHQTIVDLLPANLVFFSLLYPLQFLRAPFRDKSSYLICLQHDLFMFQQRVDSANRVGPRAAQTMGHFIAEIVM